MVPLTIIETLSVGKRECKADRGSDHPKEVKAEDLTEYEKGPNNRGHVQSCPKDPRVGFGSSS